MTVTEPRVQDSVGTALHFVRSNWQNVLIVSGIAALANTLVQSLGSLAPQLPMVTIVVVLAIYALVYAVFIGLALRGGPLRVSSADWSRLLAAMTIVAFFLCIVGFVLMMVAGIFLLGGPYASFLQEASRASGDQEAVNRILQRMWISNPWPIVLMCGFFVAVWFYLTTRLYLAAPASIDRGRILTFETWAWTKKATLKIMLGRLMLIAPAFVLTFALTYVLGRALNIDLFNAHAANPTAAGALVFAIVSAFLNYAISDAFGAGLSTALYRDLGGKNAHLPPR